MVTTNNNMSNILCTPVGSDFDPDNLVVERQSARLAVVAVVLVRRLLVYYIYKAIIRDGPRIQKSIFLSFF